MERLHLSLSFRYFCQDETARSVPPRRLLKPGALRGFTLDGHRLRSLYRILSQTRLRLTARKAPSSWFKYRTVVWGCETPSDAAKGRLS